MDNPVKTITSLPPKTLAYVVVGGVVLGVGWRYMSKRRGMTVSPDTASADTSRLALAENSTGNLAATPAVDSTVATRDLGQISLPVPQWVVTVGGERYFTNGTSLSPLNTPVTSSGSAPVPSPAQIPDYDAQYAAMQMSQLEAIEAGYPRP